MSLKNISNFKSDLILSLISAASVLRKENDLRMLFTIAKKKKINKCKIYETILQTYLFAGFPTALISLRILNEYFEFNHNYKMKETLAELRMRGIESSKKIYGDKYNKLISNTKSFSPEMAEWLVVEGYGKVLSRKNLNLKERELCIISVLASLKFEDQLYSHINGAFRLGVKQVKIEEVLELLKFLGSGQYSGFGLKVYRKFCRQKNIGISSKTK
jgi:4-carboxymuconolactone decarboxylase